MSARVMPRRLAMRSAASNWLGRSMSQDSARQLRSGPALAPSPTRLIASIPQAMPMSMAPAAISPATTDELLDVAGIDTGLVHKRLLHRAQQLGGVQPRQPSGAFADGAAGGFNNYRDT